MSSKVAFHFIHMQGNEKAEENNTRPGLSDRHCVSRISISVLRHLRHALCLRTFLTKLYIFLSLWVLRPCESDECMTDTGCRMHDGHLYRCASLHAHTLTVNLACTLTQNVVTVYCMREILKNSKQ